MHSRHMSVLLSLGAAFLFGCATSSFPRGGIEVVSMPNKPEDFDRVQAVLEAQHFCLPWWGGLGVDHFTLWGEDARRARPIIERTIREDHLSIRVTKDADLEVYEVYEGGRKVREQSFSGKHGS